MYTCRYPPLTITSRNLVLKLTMKFGCVEPLQFHVLMIVETVYFVLTPVKLKVRVDGARSTTTAADMAAKQLKYYVITSFI